MEKILLCDEHPFIRHAIKTILQAAFTGIHIKEEVNTNALLRRLAAEQFDLVITDIALPGRSGLEQLVDIKKCIHCFPCWCWVSSLRCTLRIKS